VDFDVGNRKTFEGPSSQGRGKVEDQGRLEEISWRDNGIAEETRVQKLEKFCTFVNRK
jgi:hypothetical protein